MAEPLTPSQQIIADANLRGIHTVKDSTDRVIVYKELTILEQAKLYRAAGAEHSGNEQFMQIARCAYGVESIDAIPLVHPTSLAMIDAAIVKLGDEGFIAIWGDMMERIKTMTADLEDIDSKNA